MKNDYVSALAEGRRLLDKIEKDIEAGLLLGNTSYSWGYYDPRTGLHGVCNFLSETTATQAQKFIRSDLLSRIGVSTQPIVWPQVPTPSLLKDLRKIAAIRKRGIKWLREGGPAPGGKRRKAQA